MTYYKTKNQIISNFDKLNKEYEDIPNKNNLNRSQKSKFFVVLQRNFFNNQLKKVVKKDINELNKKLGYGATLLMFTRFYNINNSKNNSTNKSITAEQTGQICGCSSAWSQKVKQRLVNNNICQVVERTASDKYLKQKLWSKFYLIILNWKKMTDLIACNFRCLNKLIGLIAINTAYNSLSLNDEDHHQLHLL